MTILYSKLFKDILSAYYANRLEEKVDELFTNPDVDKDKLAKTISALCGVEVDYSSNFIEDLKRTIDNYSPRHKVVTRVHNCCMECLDENGETNCQRACPFNAIVVNKSTNQVEVDENKCEDCGMCLRCCPSENIVDRVEFIPLIKLLKENKTVIATVAPAIIGQFGENVTINQLRSAIKKIGFSDMLEVAFFADMLTLKEAIEFNEHVKDHNDFMISSCCCPVWVSMSKKIYGDLITHVSPSVSPMIASGRAIKKINPDCKVVFIGPCVAKKTEAKNEDLIGDIDYVLTFTELRDIFEALDIHPEEMEEDLSHEYASREGRLYGHTGGVSTAVSEAVRGLFPGKHPYFTAVQADGVRPCKQMLDDLEAGRIQGRFIEGMGCVGGCVGGPKIIIPKEEGAVSLIHFAEDSEIKISMESPPMKSFLKKLDIDTEDTSNTKRGLEIFDREF